MAARACQDTQDVKVTNDDEERESCSDDDEAHKGNEVQLYVCVCAFLVRGWKRSESVADPSLDFLDMSLASHALSSTRRLHRALQADQRWITPANCMKNRTKGEIMLKRHFAIKEAKNRTAQYQTVIINMKPSHAICFSVPKTAFNDMKTLAGLFPLSVCMLWAITNRSPR